MSEVLIPIAAGLLFALVGLAIIVPAVKDFFQSVSFRRRAQRCTARVMEVEQKGTKFRPLIEFASHRGTQRLVPDSWRSRRWKIGEETVVLCDPANPADARLAEGLVDVGSTVATVIAGSIFLGGGLIGIQLGVHRPAQRAKEQVVSKFVDAAGRGDIATVRDMLAVQPDLVNAVQTNEWVKPGSSSGRRAPQSLQVLNRPLHEAARGLQPDVVELLVDRGADVNATLYGRVTALHAVGEKKATNDEASTKRVRIIELLIRHGADVNAVSKSGNTPLNQNVHDPKAVAALLAHGADVNARDEGGKTPLLRAAAIPWVNAESVKLLLDHRSDIAARDQSGDTVVTLATANPTVLELLVSRGAAANVSNKDGETPLHTFATYMLAGDLRGVDALTLLCSSGLRPDARDHAQKTPTDIARDRLAGETNATRANGLRAIVRFLSPDGPCKELVRQPASPERRKFVAGEFSCAQGDRAGCARLAWCYDTGTGTQVNRSRAAELYKPACDAGVMWTCFNLAILYDGGDGVAQDRSTARALYRKVCDSGDADACHHLEN